MRRRRLLTTVLSYTCLFAVSLFIAFFLPTTAKYTGNTDNLFIRYSTRYNVSYDYAAVDARFKSYLSLTGLDLPDEDSLSRTGYDFLGWYNNQDFNGEPIIRIQIGEFGDRRFFGQWNRSTHSITFANGEAAGLPTGWEFVIGRDSAGNDIVQTPNADGKILNINRGQTVSFRTNYNDGLASMSGWSLSDNNIVVTERYVAGEQYIYYDFSMPKNDLVASYDPTINLYIDLYNSPITFAENIMISGAAKKGFYYDYNLSNMGHIPLIHDARGYFYEWDNADPFYVTSSNRPTQNQLTLMDAMTIYLKDCIMVARDEYSDDVVGRKLNGVVIEGKFGDNFTSSAVDAWRPYGNIVLDNTLHANYSTIINFDGNNNTIAAIFQSTYINPDSNRMTVNLYGTNRNTSHLYFGSIFGNMDVNFYDLNIEQYNNSNVSSTYPDNSEYLSFLTLAKSTVGNIRFTRCNINAPNKRAYSGYGYVYIVDVNAELGSFRSAYSPSITTQSNVHFLDDCYVYYYSVTFSSSKAVFEKDLRTNGYSSSGATITNSTVVIKGNLFDPNVLTMNNNSTLIANTIVLSPTVKINGGTIVTNQLINLPNGRPVFSSTDGNISGYTTNYGKGSADNYPYPTRLYNTNSGAYEFNGGNIYLFGYYELDNNGKRSETYTTKSSDNNPLKEIILEYEQNGLTNITNEYLLNKVNNYQTTNECFVLGDSSYNLKTVSFAGANLYTACNVTLMNNTTISGGNLAINGTLSSKRDLTITGGNVSAKEIGNVYDITINENNLLRYAKTTISGGSITTNVLGAVSKEIDGRVSHSNLSITNGANLTLRDTNLYENIDIITDTYINYVYDNNFSMPTNAPNYLRFTGTLGAGINSDIGEPTLISPTLVNDQYAFIKPTTSAGESANWKNGGLDGARADYITSQGIINDGDGDAIYNYDKINLYAYQANYKLTVHNDTTSNYSVINDGTSYSGASMTISADSEVYLSLDNADLLDKVVIWYRTADGNVYNAISDYSSAIDTVNHMIIFVMPCADTDIYITENLILDLSSYDIAFTANGFATSIDSNRPTKTEFRYSGNYIIEQSLITQITIPSSFHHLTSSIGTTVPRKTGDGTDHRIVFEPNSGNRNHHNITLRKIYQTFAEAGYGIDIADGNDVVLTISGANYIMPIRMTEHTNLEIAGTNKTTDVLQIYGGYYDSMQIGNPNGKVGNLTYRNLWLFNYTARIIYAKTVSTNSTLLFDNVDLDLYVYYRYALSYNVPNVHYVNSSIGMDFGGDTADSSGAFFGVTNLTLDNTELYFTSGQGRSYTRLFAGINGKIQLNGNSHIEYNLRNSLASLSYYETITNSTTNQTVELNDDSSIRMDHRIQLNNLVINDNAEFIVDHLGTNTSDITQDTYLFCPHIEINGGSLTADNIVMSGFYNNSAQQSSESALIAQLNTNNNSKIIDGNSYAGLVINGGTINASNFVGGDKHSKITINDGVLNATKIGTIGKLYGFASYLPIEGQPYVYDIDKIPAGASINIYGGTINVSPNGYLGGMLASVNIDGGSVNLGNGAVLGINEDDKVRLANTYTSAGQNIPSLVSVRIVGGNILGGAGIINTPYSTLNISNNAAINVYQMHGISGTINIYDVNDGYSNPYADATHESVGVLCTGDISAKHLLVSNNAIVYSNEALSSTQSGENGTLIVNNGGYLYTNIYGTSGLGDSTVTTDSNAFGIRQYTIHFTNNDTYQDPATNPNPLAYLEQIGINNLLDASRFGYTFDGWYNNSEFSGDPATMIGTEETGNKTFYAKWVPLQAQFKVSVNRNEIGLSNAEFADAIAGLDGTLNGDTFTFNTVSIVNYRDPILGNGHLQLSNYNLNGYVIAEVKIANSAVNPEDLPLDSSDIIDETIMRYYLDNNIPLEIRVLGINLP